ncbi:sulfatase family protein [Thalassotalea crassostreae]|uniref:sulfatase family protein n=1 Tax=Thalassotalea crassostreae TaxID=1763536 RepID=UPI000837BEEC|nr:arylsulfatase [Thalassotalea crassostreae]
MIRKVIQVVLLLPLVLPAMIEAKEIKPLEFPNIVILYADDLGYGDVSVQNSESKIATPNIDALAAQGIRYTDAHSSSGVCSPSRYALLTGNYHWRRQHSIVGSFEPSYFEKDEFTLAKMLQTKGYRTAMLGKWHLGWNWQSVVRKGASISKVGKKGSGYFKVEDIDWTKPLKGGPVDLGFDSYYGDGTINFPPYAWIENDKFVTAPSKLSYAEIPEVTEGKGKFRLGPQADDWKPFEVLPRITERAVKIIDEHNAEKPLFLYFSFPSPHAPIIPNKEFIGKSKAGSYGDFVYQTDWVVGEIVKALKDKGIEDDTLVIFSSDNGPEYYAYERMKKHGHASMANLRGAKRDIWEGGHRVPFIAKWPAKISAGKVSDELFSQVDLLATIASIVDYPLSNEVAVDSYNMLASLTGKNDNVIRQSTVHNTSKGKYAIRVGDWVLVDHSKKDKRQPKWYLTEYGYNLPSKSFELFNLRTDIEQKHNVASKHPERVKEMQALLLKYQTSGRSVKR